ncbi:hypothetical protein K491DRAFT_700286 [Lophiostoma macrostomum CBS 122681]|uniref:Uncharacterized protein n=1 Tax=Lophiostoma macrostomum CBS 122681 TaxID=1314788 RepID=A0A6A6TR20_9PLEO|nr:hypothetical protein K491DRAFT_700286 [Lophiostoma macrostomum CBS 122681]
MINGSSVYSDSPAPSNNNTPKPPFLGFLRRPQSPPDPIVITDNDLPRGSSDSRSPLRPQHTAGSYLREIAPLQDPQEPETIYNRHPADRHPADVPLGHGEVGHGSLDPETEQLQEEVHGRRRRRRRHHHHRRRKHHQPHNRYTHWIRRRHEKSICFPFVKTQAARGKAFACLISGLFLTTVLAIYLAIALTRKDLGQEIHVLFIMIILATTIFFCHSLIRLFMLVLHPPDEGPRIPSMTGPEGFNPVRPIRVHLARDEELGVADDVEDELSDSEKEKKVALPPPAYGLWRSSVRVDPNLLHWQRVEANAAAANGQPSSRLSSHPNSRSGSVSGAPAVEETPATPSQTQNQNQGPRPPSYVSEDGVSYVVEAAPRSVAPSHSGVSDIHPAWRPGYAMSEIHADEWPRTRRV